MNKVFEIQEFDLITCNKEYIGSSNYKYLDKKPFSELEEFILENNNKSDITSYLKISVKRNIGKVIQAQNYVGLIQLKSGYKIQILPKIACLDNLANKNLNLTKSIFIKMICSMKDFPIKVFNFSDLDIEKMNLYEIFISMFICETTVIIKRGLRSSYNAVEDNLNFYKGKLIVNEHIKKNLIHKEHFYMRYDEFNTNRPENKLIKSTLLKLLKESNNFNNKKKIKQLLLNFENIQVSQNYDNDFSKVIIDKNTKDYVILMKWCKVFLKNKSFTTFSGEEFSRSLLFPMEKVFESYIAQKIKQKIREDNWRVSVQDKGYYLFDFPKRFSLKPDIVITKDNKEKIILDTKWKYLHNNAGKNYGISQADMYQMYAYAKKYKASQIYLIYPVNEEMQYVEDIQYCSDDNVSVKIFFVDLYKIEESIEKLRNNLIYS